MRPLRETIPILIQSTVDTIANRPRYSPEEQIVRAEAARCQIEAFNPRDGVEVMLAGQIVVMQAMMLEAASDAARAATPEAARKHRQQVIAMGRAQMTAMKEIRLHRVSVAKAAASGVEVGGVEEAPGPEAELAGTAAERSLAGQDPHMRPLPSRGYTAPLPRFVSPAPATLPGLPARRAILSAAAQLEQAVYRS